MVYCCYWFVMFETFGSPYWVLCSTPGCFSGYCGPQHLCYSYYLCCLNLLVVGVCSFFQLFCWVHELAVVRYHLLSFFGGISVPYVWFMDGSFFYLWCYYCILFHVLVGFVSFWRCLFVWSRLILFSWSSKCLIGFPVLCVFFSYFILGFCCVLLFYIVFVVFSSFLLRYLCYIRLLFVFEIQKECTKNKE
jgi:hypothetical protein